MTKLAQELIEREKEERTGYLELGLCGLTELPDLSDLYWLETLIVSDDWWNWDKYGFSYSLNSVGRNELSSLLAEHLPVGLKKLDLGGGSNGKWKISDLSFLEKLANLNSLSLNNNEISDGNFIEKLTCLTSLDLSNNQIKNGDFLKKLSKRPKKMRKSRFVMCPRILLFRNIKIRF